jgi:hypothetical protein
VHEVETLRVRVPRFEVLVRERPRGRDAAVVGDLAEVLRAEAKECRAVELRVATDVIVLLRRELVALSVAPLFVGRVLPLQEDGGRVPVVTLAREIAAPFEEPAPMMTTS